MTDRKLMKDYFDIDLAKRYADNISEVYPEFKSADFIKETSSLITDGRMSERINVFAEQLRKYLPNDYTKATEIIIAILEEENDEFYFPFERTYYYRAIETFVGMYGEADFDQSIKTMEEITKRHSSEFSVRPFILRDYDKMEKVFSDWGQHSNAHLRRLVTEGTRPRLPWAKKLPFIRNDIDENFKLLKPFLNDSSRYVEKSVANHLNDLSKDEPDKVITFIKENLNETSVFIVKRALRTLKKNENSQALAILEELKENR